VKCVCFAYMCESNAGYRAEDLAQGIRRRVRTRCTESRVFEDVPGSS
jgi:hypothetical protein